MRAKGPTITRRGFLGTSAAAVGGLLVNSMEPSTAPAAQSIASGSATGAPDLPSLTITEAARLLSSRQLSPVELTRAYLNRIEVLNPKVGAFITVTGEQALDAARLAERDIVRGAYRGPLHGIPFGVKDTFYTQGVLTTAGSHVLRDFRPSSDATAVRRLKEAGAILVGKTNLPEFSFGGVTPGCSNPWDLSRNSGGSSGGSGAALAASLLLAATGGDTSGSIRNPASTCGVVGHKPTFGLVSRHRVVPISWTLDHLGPMAKTVEDTAIVLKAMAGHDPKDPFSADVRPADYPGQLRRSVSGLKVGFLAESEMQHFHPDTRGAFLAAVKVLETLGAQIRPITFSERMKVAGAAHGIIRICEAAAYHRQYLKTSADEYRHVLDKAATGHSNTRTTVEAGSLLTAAQYLKAQQVRVVFLEEMYRVFEPLDVLLDPTMPAPAGVEADGAQAFRNYFDLCGFPAVSLPCGFSTDPPGLPIGLQISARPFQDALVLAVAYAYESASDWHTRRPVL